jgi:hypothetical protein
MARAIVLHPKDNVATLFEGDALLLAARDGRPIPEGWALVARIQPTIDAYCPVG